MRAVQMIGSGRHPLRVRSPACRQVDRFMAGHAGHQRPARRRSLARLPRIASRSAAVAFINAWPGAYRVGASRRPRTWLSALASSARGSGAVVVCRQPMNRSGRTRTAPVTGDLAVAQPGAARVEQVAVEMADPDRVQRQAGLRGQVARGLAPWPAVLSGDQQEAPGAHEVLDGRRPPSSSSIQACGSGSLAGCMAGRPGSSSAVSGPRCRRPRPRRSRSSSRTRRSAR